MGILWVIVIGFVAGLIARWLAPGPNNPVGFLLTTALGIAGAFLATYIGQAVGWYRVDQARPDRSNPRRRRRAVRLASPCRQPHDQRSWKSRASIGTWPAPISLTINVIGADYSLASLPGRVVFGFGKSARIHQRRLFDHHARVGRESHNGCECVGNR